MQRLLSYGLALQTQRVTAEKIIWGFGLGYDLLTAMTHIEPYLGTGNYIGGVPTDGKIRLHTHTIRANPYFGYRIPIKKVNLDLNAGFHLSYILKSSQTVTYDDQPKGVDKKSHFTKINTKFDVGPSAGLTVSYNHLSINANYTHGLLNYRRKLDGANFEVFSRYLRLGVGYRLNN